MTNITKADLVAAMQAVKDIDAEIAKAHEGYRHGATATEAVEFDLAMARLQAKRNKATDEYQMLLSRVAAAIAKKEGEGGE